MIDIVKKELSILREKKPLVINYTNYVTMDFMANVLLSLGAVPIMSVCDQEVEELVSISSAININIGTLDDNFINRVRKVVAAAEKYNKPIVLDPVGAGASKIRTETAAELFQSADIVRGNASEIMALAGQNNKTRGVESMHTTDQAQESAKSLTVSRDCAVIISGEIDYVTDSKSECKVESGHNLMPLITGMGCAFTAVVTAFRAVNPDKFIAAKAASMFYGECGRLAGQSSHQTASFKSNFVDCIYEANFEQMNECTVKESL